MVPETLAASQGDTVLERMKDALATLKDPEVEFDFTEWQACTCGHIYGAAKRIEPGPSLLKRLIGRGRRRERFFAVAPIHTPIKDGGAGRRTIYTQMLRAVIEGNSTAFKRTEMSTHDAEHEPASVVSAMTSEMAMEKNIDERKAAIRLIRGGVRYLEKKYRDDMEAVARA